MARKKKVAIVEEDNNLVRDLSTNAIINTNGNAYERRLEQIQKKQSQEEIDAAQRADIEQLKADMKEIKAMLKKLGGK
jgi:mevalonate kinase|tara:strand:+ start:187 stop:420 length:234 start_codon:yes stop_codon:yes gene_type:complete